MRSIRQLLATCWVVAMLGLGGRGLAASPVSLDFGNETAPTLSVYTARDGLSDEVWNALGIDDEGYVWAGSASTLARFDGFRWELQSGLPARSLVNDLEVIDGRLSALFASEGMVQRDGRLWRLQSLPDSTFLLRIFRTPRADGGIDIWMGFGNGLLRRVHGRWEPDPGNSASPSAVIGFVRTERLLAGQPRHWLFTRSGVLVREVLDEGRFGPWYRFEDPRLNATNFSDAVRAVDRGVESLWVLTYGNGIMRIRDDGIRTWRSATGELPTESMYTGVASNEPDGRGVLWVASRAGLLRIRDDVVTTYDRRHGLPSDAVRDLMLQKAADGSDLLWLATEAGIARADLSAQQWSTVSRLGSRENGTFAVLVEPDEGSGERLWVGTSRDGIGMLQGGRWRYFRKADGSLPEDSVRQIWRLKGPDGRPWRLISLFTAGLWRIHDDDRLERLPAPWLEQGVSKANTALARTVNGHHEFWFGTDKFGAYRWRDGNWTRFSVEGMPDPWSVIRMVEQVDRTGRSWLWAASEQGLMRFDGEHWLRLSGLPGLPEDRFRGVSVVREGAIDTLWAGTERHGLVRLDITDPMQPHEVLDDPLPPPPDPFVYNALSDSVGRVYVCTNNGVQQLARGDGGHWRSRVFKRQDGLVHDECNTNAQMVDSHDRYWVGTLAGLSVFDPNVDARADVPAQPATLRFSAIAVDGKPVVPIGTLRLPAGANELRVDFGLLGTQRESEATFRSRLAGYDQGPGAWVSERRRVFTHLPPGQYRLEVDARDFAARPSSTLVLDIVVAARWWQQTWVRLGMALLAVLGMMAIVRAYVGAMARRQHLLEQQVAARTSELHEANRQLTELSYLDPLTGVANRRRLVQAMENGMAQAKAREQNVGVIVIDIDHFKEYNDRFGHLTGDVALRAVAQALTGAKREQDLVARYGGEEFACLMVDVTPELAVAVAERMRARVEALVPRVLGNDTQGLTLSAGVVCRQPRLDERAEDLLASADAALYAAKKSGRNRVCVAQ